jgi:hypothetical protein
MSILLYRLSNEISEEDLFYYLDLIGNKAAQIDLFETYNLDNFTDITSYQSECF